MKANTNPCRVRTESFDEGCEPLLRGELVDETPRHVMEWRAVVELFEYDQASRRLEHLASQD
jgi:hypothetical protein